jgi:predicted DNA-binding antitoxin AbrB/MazE fold protein
MLIEYKIGVNRVLYKSVDLRSGVNVTVKILSPDLVWNEWILKDVNEGIYYLDYDFTKEGKYVVKFYENGVFSCVGFYDVSPLEM